MATAGPRFPGTVASLANAGSSENAEAWVSPGNASADDGTVTSITAASYDTPDISQLLVCSNFGFAADFADTATIDGITVEIDRNNAAGAASDNRVQLATGTTFATLVGTNKAATATDWPAALATVSYGGVADTWTAGLTAAQVRAVGFAVMVSVQADTTNVDVAIDFVRVTITYTAAAADDAPAEVATATGAANNAVGGVKASAGSAAATGSAPAPKPNISPSVGLADATGAALDATVDAQSASGTSVDAGLAAATGSALNATSSTTEVPEGPPGAVGVALAPAMSVAVNAATATAIGAAGAITASTTDTAPAETATAVGAARDATISTASVVTANAGLASAIGQAGDATTASTGPIEADAGLAAASGAAYGALIRIGGGGRGGRVIVRADQDEEELIAQLLLVA